MARNRSSVVAFKADMDSLRKILAGATPQTCAKLLEPAVKASIEPVLVMAKRLAKRSEDTGALRDSLIKKTVAYKNSGVVVGLVGPDKAARIKGKKAHTLQLIAGMAYRRPAHYAHLIEYGHRVAKGGNLRDRHKLELKGTGRYNSKGKEIRRFQKGALLEKATGTSSGFVAPRPFIRPAVTLTKSQQAAIFERVLVEEVNKYVNKKGRA